MAASYPNTSTYEQQKDNALDGLFNKVRALREVTVNIHSDSDQDRTLLNEASSTFDQLGTGLAQTSRRLVSQSVQLANKRKITVGIVTAFICLWAVWHFFL